MQRLVAASGFVVGNDWFLLADIYCSHRLVILRTAAVGFKGYIYRSVDRLLEHFHPIFLILLYVETLDRHCSFEHFSRQFLPIPALVLGDFGGAEFTLPSSFDCYPLEAVERLVE
ncbi:dynamin-related protein 1E [Dorcoceras hygrometricum]|uniref:Dynamin-related protein 1E n=1 Tax=Dorcoceras hygrometricum TaxID=472368 RepID=A0A2Z7D971_9LAMI|nr:dynamin-related protein 1E [Dorcoceras hygrometricum]